MKRQIVLLITIFTAASIVFAQSVEIKDNNEDILISINEEGSGDDDGGSITLPDAGSVSPTTNKLYNEGGTLKWGGDALGTVGSAGGWTDGGTDVYLTTTSDNVGIGTTSPNYFLHVVGSNSGGAVGHFVNTVTSHSGHGVYGACDNTDNYGIGGFFEGGYMGAYSQVTPNASTNYYGYGLYGNIDTEDAYEGYGINYGVYGNAQDGYRNYGVYGYANGGTGTVTNYGVYGFADGTGTNYAGYFDGNVHVNGTLSKGGGSFKIDHPLDPINKNLLHSFVESPDMMNIYNGNIVTNANGEAVVEMPDYFEPLNKEFRYQLTCIGGFAPLYISEEISDNRFKIAGGEAGMKVSWQVTGIRQDAFANANRIQVEEDKRPDERGKYLHPEAFGMTREMSVDYHPEQEAEIQKMEEQNRKHDERRVQEKKEYQEQK